MTETIEPAENPLNYLALLATGRTGADIERLVREARQVARRQKRPVSWSDLEHALRGGQMQMSDDLRWRVSIHEAGHAVAWSLLGVGEVLSATVGLQGPGAVMTRPYGHLAQTQDWMRRTVACLLAGRAAEMLVFGDALAGSGGHDDSDLARATDCALSAETSLGFSEHMPLLYRSPRTSFDALTLDRDLAARVHARLTAAEEVAARLLTERRPELLEIAERLRLNGVMEGGEIRDVLGLQGRATTDSTTSGGAL